MNIQNVSSSQLLKRLTATQFVQPSVQQHAKILMLRWHSITW